RITVAVHMVAENSDGKPVMKVELIVWAIVGVAVIFRPAGRQRVFGLGLVRRLGTFGINRRACGSQPRGTLLRRRLRLRCGISLVFRGLGSRGLERPIIFVHNPARGDFSVPHGRLSVVGLALLYIFITIDPAEAPMPFSRTVPVTGNNDGDFAAEAREV